MLRHRPVVAILLYVCPAVRKGWVRRQEGARRCPGHRCPSLQSVVVKSVHGSGEASSGWTPNLMPAIIAPVGAEGSGARGCSMICLASPMYGAAWSSDGDSGGTFLALWRGLFER
eukprot:7545580-Pyramimonas_sp.AAC.1